MLIIDRLPPRIGGFLLSIGPQILHVDEKGYTTLPDILHTLTLSLVGGPTEVQAILVPKTEQSEATDSQKYQHISLHRKNNSNLWSTDLSFITPGTFTVQVHAKDGAGNEVSKDITSVTVLSPGKIIDTSANPVKSTITLYTKDAVTGSFIEWDGSAYGQQNPQKTTADGVYAYYPPSGTYYLSIDRGFGSPQVITNSFQMNAGEPLSPNLVIPKSNGIQLFGFSIPFPSLFRQHITIDKSQRSVANTNASIDVGKILTEQLLTTIDPSRSFVGHNTTLVLLNTWAPQTPAQIRILEAMKEADPQRTILGVFPHESNATIELFAKRGDYTILLRADPDGSLLEELPYPAVPTFFTMDDKLFVSSLKQGFQVN